MVRNILLGVLFMVSTGFTANVRQDETPNILPKQIAFGKGAPHEINYQGWLGSATDTTGITDVIGMSFRIYTVPTGGISVWNETHMAVSVDKGIFNVILGSVNPIPSGTFTGIPLWIETQAGNDTLSPRKKLVSVGYAIRAEKADTATIANLAYTAWTANTATNAIYADTAEYVAGANVVGEVAKANLADTALYAMGGGGAAYADTAGIALRLQPPETLVTSGSQTPLYLKATGGGKGLYILRSVDGVYVDSAMGGGEGFEVNYADGNGVQVDNANDNGVYVNNAGDNGVYVNNAGKHGINVVNADTHGVYVNNAGDNGVYVNNAGKHGINVVNADTHGVYVGTAGRNGVYVDSAGSYGVYVDRTGAGGDGVWVKNAGDDGFYVSSAGSDGIYVNSAGDNGVYVGNVGEDGVYVSNAGDDGLHVYNAVDKGVYANGKKFGGVFQNDTTGTLFPALYVYNTYGNTSAERIANFYANGIQRFYFRGDGWAYADLGWGTFKKDGKGSAVPYQPIQSRDVELIASGNARLQNGVATITLDKEISKFASGNVDLRITVTSKGSWSGLYIAQSSAGNFVVKSGAGDPNATFDWMVIAREKGYEIRTELSAEEIEQIVHPTMTEERIEKQELEGKINRD
ncbi:MAG: hypothetical protein HY769_04230 [Candidatus Stahlbacteria bacterium]|nr:hypothetical protein [Candidatus Stahlbacteria bacterium]